jgi:hypothetical protein
MWKKEKLVRKDRESLYFTGSSEMPKEKTSLEMKA